MRTSFAIQPAIDPIVITPRPIIVRATLHNVHKRVLNCKFFISRKKIRSCYQLDMDLSMRVPELEAGKFLLGLTGY